MRGIAIGRRSVLAAFAFLGVAGAAGARMVFGALPFARFRTLPPIPVDTADAWRFFTVEEAATVKAIVDRLIPADALSIGGREAGCAIFIDRQLAGDYGRSSIWYLAGPERAGTPQQGPQTTQTTAARYRGWLAALDRHCRAQPGGHSFDALHAEAQDALLQGLEDGKVALDGADGRPFFNQILSNTREGYFADPLYGGNRDMAGWKLVGFPGARYDYRDVIGRRGEALGLEPVSIFRPKEG